MGENQRVFTFEAKTKILTGWMFLAPAVLLIILMSFLPMFRALILSFKSGIGQNMAWAGLYNYTRMFKDTVFIQSIKIIFLTLIIQVPIMLTLALVLASMLNNKQLKFKGLFRTAIFCRVQHRWYHMRLFSGRYLQLMDLSTQSSSTWGSFTQVIIFWGMHSVHALSW